MDHRWTDLGHSNNNSNNSSSYKSNHQHHILLISPSSRLCTLCVQVVAVAVVVVPTHTKVSMSERARCPSLSYVRQLTLCVRWRTQIHHSNRIQVAEQRRLSSTDCKETYVRACVCLIADTHRSAHALLSFVHSPASTSPNTLPTAEPQQLSQQDPNDQQQYAPYASVITTPPSVVESYSSLLTVLAGAA